jgi:hypothetical protein
MPLTRLRLVNEQKGQKMSETEVSLNYLCEQLKSLSADVKELKKKADGDKGSDSDLSELAALLPLFGLFPLGLGATFLFPLSLRLGAARALALSRALEHAAKVTGHAGKEHGGSGAGMSEAMQQLFKLKLTNEDQRKLLEAIAIYWKAKNAGS